MRASNGSNQLAVHTGRRASGRTGRGGGGRSEAANLHGSEHAPLFPGESLTQARAGATITQSRCSPLPRPPPQPPGVTHGFLCARVWLDGKGGGGGRVAPSNTNAPKGYPLPPLAEDRSARALIAYLGVGGRTLLCDYCKGFGLRVCACCSVFLGNRWVPMFRGREEDPVTFFHGDGSFSWEMETVMC